MKKNKKIYNFTDRQRRRDRSLNTIHFHTVGKYWKKRASKQLRMQNKAILRLIQRNEDDLAFVRYRKYMWWDF